VTVRGSECAPLSGAHDASDFRKSGIVELERRELRVGELGDVLRREYLVAPSCEKDGPVVKSLARAERARREPPALGVRVLSSVTRARWGRGAGEVGGRCRRVAAASCGEASGSTDSLPLPDQVAPLAISVQPLAAVIGRSVG
jgi:hypothetical protein